MSDTGEFPRETFPLRSCIVPFSLAFTALILGAGIPAQAAEYDPNSPRVEEVLDTDGSTWKVMIVPRPRNRPIVPQRRAVMRATPRRGVLPSVKPDLPPTPSEKPKPKRQYEDRNDAPAKGETSINLQPQTELISTQSQDEKAPAEKPAAEPVDNSFGVEIVPRFSYPMLPPSAGCCSSGMNPMQVNPLEYAWIYQSIPFNRSEYVANPRYRHDATMEILLGQLRPQAANQPAPQPRPHHTLFPFENNFNRPNSYYSIGPSMVHGGGSLPFGFAMESLQNQFIYARDSELLYPRY